ncbi:hypothetical protein GDO81_002847, partial [Engystomops pustulosus]
RIGPPLDISLEAINCTAFSVQWRMPRQHVSTINGYTKVILNNLQPGTLHRVSVGAYSWAGKGRASMPRDVSTLSPELCLVPDPPLQPQVVVVSDTEVAVSWKQGASEGSSPILYYLVAYRRPDDDSDWVSITEQVEMDSMVLKGLSPDTEYQFGVKSVNSFGDSLLSTPSEVIKTFREYH